MKKCVLFALLFTLALVPMKGVSAEEAKTAETAVATTITELSATMRATQTVNVRDLPDLSGKVIGKVKRNTEVTVTGQCNETGWYRIAYNNGIGYVSGSYLTAAPAQAAQPTSAQGYPEFTEPLYTAWFDGTNFYFYHDQTENGYFAGHESIGKLAESLKPQLDEKYSYDKGYYGYLYSMLDDQVEIMGKFKNTSKYLEPSQPYMTVVKITCPLRPMTGPNDAEAEAQRFASMFK